MDADFGWLHYIRTLQVLSFAVELLYTDLCSVMQRCFHLNLSQGYCSLSSRLEAEASGYARHSLQRCSRTILMLENNKLPLGA